MTMLYEGKAKQIFSTDNPNEIIIHYKDDATAGNGAKKGTIVNKGVINNKITAIIYNYLESKGVKTHLIEMIVISYVVKLKLYHWKLFVEIWSQEVLQFVTR